MSNSLVRKSLELFVNDGVAKDLCNGGETLTKSISLGKIRKKTKNTLKDLKVKSKIDEYRKKRLGDQTEKNLDLLLKLSNSAIPKEMTRKVLKRQREKLSKDLAFEKIDFKKPKQETSCFTEDDFAWFEKEYYVR